MTYFVANFGILVQIEILSTSSHIKLVRKKCVKLKSGSLRSQLLLQILSLSSNRFPASLISEIIHLMFDDARAKVRKVDRPSISIRGRLGGFEDSVSY